MFCPKCGTKLPDDAQFCAECGSALKRQAAAAATAAAQAAQPGADADRAPASAAAAPAATEAAAAAAPAGEAVAKRGFSPKIVGLIAVALAALVAVALGMTMCSGGGLFGPSVEVKESLADYSWAELSQISGEIAKAGSEENAVKVAVKYNLAGKDGRLDGTQTKLVGMSGSQVPVRIIGFAHDDKTDGGKAGITFQFSDCVAEHAMNPKSTEEADYNTYAKASEQELAEVAEYYKDGVPTNAGGWEASEMRSWLNGEFFEGLPEELSAVIVPVENSTNNIGWMQDYSEATVSSTSDRVWLPSFMEVCGGFRDSDFTELDNQAAEYEEGSEEYEDIMRARQSAELLNEEGAEYKLYRDMNVSNNADNGILTKYLNGSAAGWWLRTPISYVPGSFAGVYGGGNPTDYYSSDYARGVSPCFCV